MRRTTALEKTPSQEFREYEIIVMSDYNSQALYRLKKEGATAGQSSLGGLPGGYGACSGWDEWITGRPSGLGRHCRQCEEN